MEPVKVVKYVIVVIIAITALLIVGFVPSSMATLISDDFSRVLFWIGFIGSIGLAIIIAPSLNLSMDNLIKSAKWLFGGGILVIILNILFPILVGWITDTTSINLSYLILTITEVLTLTIAPIVCLTE